MFQYYFQHRWKNGEVEKRNVPILLPKSMEKWRSGETECSDTTSQIYGEIKILTQHFIFLRTYTVTTKSKV